MECNREEAIKAQELAIQKFWEQEYSAAKKLALKAQAMCPDLDGIAQFLVVLDVFISSQVKIGDETDWYEVLGVSTSSDDATIKKHYKAKALALHPDKNKSVGSTDAFQLMHSAYEILSDPNLRAEHDAKRLRSRVEATNNSGNPNPNSARNQGAAQHSERAGVFWTFCLSCSRYLQYREIFRGQVLYCKCCMSPFVAKEFASPPSDTSHRARREGPSSSNPNPMPHYFHHHQQGFSNPGFGWSWAHQGFSSHGNPGSSSNGFAQDSSWDHYRHHHHQQHDYRGPEYTTSGHAQGSAWAPPQSFFGQMNMGSGPSFYNWSGSNINSNLNFDFNRFGSNDIPSAPLRTDASSMKRRFETTDGAVNGREEGRGDSNKKRDVRQECRDIVVVNFSNDNNHNGGDDDDDQNSGDSRKKRVVLRAD